MNFWDPQFALPAFKYGKTPNQFLREQAHQRPLAPRCYCRVTVKGATASG